MVPKIKIKKLKKAKLMCQKSRIALKTQIKWIKIKVNKLFHKFKQLDLNKGQEWKINCFKAKTWVSNNNKQIHFKHRYIKTAKIQVNRQFIIRWLIHNPQKIWLFCNLRQMLAVIMTKTITTLQPNPSFTN